MIPVQSAAPFPELDADQAAHADRVLAAVRAAIAARGGALPFDEYMELALYAPGLGYYAAGARKLGAAGDFVTAPELSPLFGRALARQVAEVAAAVGGDTVLELGPGSGALAAALLPELAVLGAAPARYLMLEPSPDLRQRQRERLDALRAATPGLATELVWLERLPDRPIAGTILANEVLDALPCERFVIGADGPRELAVVARDGALALAERPAGAALREALRAIELELGAPLPAGFAHEWRSRLAPFVATLAGALDRGLLLFVDYGLGRRELYDARRGRGTFRAHHRQRAFDDALFRPGLCDLTAWVDFTAAADAAMGAGLGFAGYTTQAHLLLGCGLGELLAEPLAGDAPAAVAQARRSRDAQLLTLPDEMGERFKALGLHRGLDQALPLRGFALRDLSHTL
jgi:SAM-dependent MidA family methyltransferase